MGRTYTNTMTISLTHFHCYCCQCHLGDTIHHSIRDDVMHLIGA